MSGFCTSGYAFGDYMDRDDEKMLYKAYKAAGMKRFHSMHAATMREGGATVFYSYYTELARYFYCEHSDRYCLVVSPFTYDAAKYCKSVTSAKQLNKWIFESGIEFDFARIRDYYNRAYTSDIGQDSETFKKIYARKPDSTYAVPVELVFLNEQHFLNEDGKISCKIVNSRVPKLAYNTSEEHMFKVGTYVHHGNECGLVRSRH